MTRSTLLLAPAAIALFVVGCDRSSPTDNLESGGISIAPRILATGPLPGARVHLSLVHGHDTTAKVDTTYTSGRHLALGSVPVGDSFEVVVRGYDVAGNGFKQITWNGIVRSQALGSTTSLLAVDIQADTVPFDRLDTAYNPTYLYLPDGAWYTINGSDPRAKDTGNGVHISDGSSIPKSGILVVATKSASVVPGDTVWSPLQRLNFDSLTSGMRTLLTGVWWEDDTTAYGNRCVLQDTFKNDGRFKEVYYDTLSLLPLSVDSGTWLVNGNVLEMTYGDGSYNTITLTSRGSNYTLSYDNTGWYGLLTRNKPAASVDPYAVHFSLVGTWVETYTYTYITGAKDVFYYIDTLRADSTYTSTQVDSLKVPISASRSGNWSADSNHFIEKNSTSIDTASMSVNTGGGFRLDYSDGSYSICKALGTDTAHASPSDTLHDAIAMAALAGTWIDANSDTVTFDANGSALWVWHGTNYAYSWSANQREIFLYPGQATSPEYTYPYSGSASTISLEGDDYTRK